MDTNTNQRANTRGNSRAASNRGSNHDSNTGNESTNPITNPTTTNPTTMNPHARVTPTTENPRGYPPFEMSLVPNYMNNQIHYYYTTGAIPAAELSRFHQLMKQRKVSLEMIGWDGASDNENADSTEYRTVDGSIRP